MTRWGSKQTHVPGYCCCYSGCKHGHGPQELPAGTLHRADGLSGNQSNALQPVRVTGYLDGRPRVDLADFLEWKNVMPAHADPYDYGSAERGNS